MFIAITAHHWVRSNDWLEAVRKVRKSAPISERKKVLLYHCDDPAVAVSGMGDLVSKSPCVLLMKTEDAGRSWYKDTKDSSETVKKFSVVDLYVKLCVQN